MQATDISSMAQADAYLLDYDKELLAKNDVYLKIFEEVVGALGEEQDACCSHLQAIAYSHIDHSHSFTLRTNIHVSALRVALYSQTRNVSDIASCLLRTLEEQYVKPSKESESKAPEVADKTFPTWAEKNGNTSDKISISWGGGKQFLEKFLEGAHDGYATEAGKKGMFVNTSAAMRDRDILYATRTPIIHFDTPCILEAEIDPKVLLQVNNNSYEAVLPKSAVHLLQNRKITVVDLSKINALQRDAILRDILPVARLDFATNTYNWRPVLGSRAGGKYSPERIDRLVAAYNEYG